MSKIYSNLELNGQFVYNNNPTSGYVLTTDDNGLVSWTASVNTIATASSAEFGLVKIGSGLTVSNTGVLSTSGASGTTYIAGTGLILSGTTFSIATASSGSIGGIIVGSGLTVSNTGLLSVSGGGTTYTPGAGLTLSGSTFSLLTPNYKVIYVSVSGSDSNNGLSTFSPVLNLWKARDLAVSGDTVVVMPGSYIFDNRNAVGCPYNGLVDTKVNLWKDGVTYNFMPGAKIYSYGSTSGSYSPYSDSMIFFQPNSLTYSVCTVIGDLEFYAVSEGADNSGGAAYLFLGVELSGSSTYPGYTFYGKFKYIESCSTPLSAVRTAAITGAASIYIDVQKIKYEYITGQSSYGAFSVWRGGDNSELSVNIKVGEIIGAGSNWQPIFKVQPYSTSGINKLRVNIDVDYASMLYSSYLFWYCFPGSGGNYISSGQVIFNCNSCVFSSSLFWIVQNFKNYFVTITGNYYCSGTFTGKYSSFPSTYPFICLWDQTNDAQTDNSIVDFKGNYYANNPTRTIVHVGATNTIGTPPLYGYTNNIGNFTGDIYFAGTASNYTGTLFYVDEGKFRFSGRIHGTKNYSGYGFGGSVMKFGGSSAGFLTNTHIHSDLDSSLVSYGTPASGQSILTISNSFIDMTGTSSVIGDMRNLNTYIQNSTIRNRGTNDMFYNSLSTGTLQITNSTLINSSSTASTINYPLGTVIGAGAFSNKEIIVSTLSGTVSVVSGLI